MDNNFPDFEIIDEKTAVDFPESLFMSGGSHKPNEPEIKEGSPDAAEKVDNDPNLQTKKPELNLSDDDVRRAFGVEEEPEEKKTTKKPDPKKEESVDSDPTFKVIHESFVKAGLLDEDKEFDGTEESFVSAFHKREEKQKENVYKQIQEELGANGLALIRHLRNGGEVEDFVQTFSDPLKNVDLENASHQKAVIRNYYERAGWEDADIEQELKDIEDLGEDKLKEKAGKFYSKIQAQDKADQEEFTRTQEAEEQRKKVEYQNFVSEVNEIIDSNQEIMGVPIGRSGKEVKDYMFKPTVRLQNGQVVSKYVADRIKNQNNKQLYVLNAILSMNGYKLPTSSEEAATTKATLGIKKQLEQARKQPIVPGKVSKDDSEESSSSGGGSLNWESLFGK